MLVFERRASTIIYKFLLSNFSKKKFIIPCNVCPVIPLIFLKAGCKFEFCDIEEDSYCISKELVLQKLKNKKEEYAGILYVRTYGIATNQSDFFNQVKAVCPSVLIIDDKCLCIPSFENENNICDLTLFSTGHAKFVDINYGGFAFVANELKYLNKNIQKIDSKIINLNFSNQINLVENSLRNKLKFKYIDNDWLDLNELENTGEYIKIVNENISKELKYRSKLNTIYDKYLPDHVKLPKEFQNWRYNILVPDKDIILNEIIRKGLFTSSHYKTISHAFNNNSYIISENLSKQVINLFNNNKFTTEMAIELCAIINSFLKY